MLWRERIFQMKESVVRHEYGSDCRRHNVRFEERAREFILLATVNFYERSQRETNKSAAVRSGTTYYQCVESAG